MARELAGYPRESAEGVLLCLLVSPGAKKTEIKAPHDEDASKIAVAAPPEKGRANAGAEQFLAGAIGVSVLQVKIARGAGRDKAALVRGVYAERAGEALEALTGG